MFHSHRHNVRPPTFQVVTYHFQASARAKLTVEVPSDFLSEGASYAFTLRVATLLGGSAEATVIVFKSTQDMLSLKVLFTAAVE